ncbi:MAG TPA: NADPH-dependent assimilatory sulfite reductase hemoprotein subunit [Bryobacteraceae bacterium]|nr:NADPH-dependent assimilatory sulfite reductase hemoprotein subunit [Bryobacteraceae bacterium]
MPAAENRSQAEIVKESSAHLRGTIIEELSLPAPNFSKQAVQILKFHGIYQQSDRDNRKAGKGYEYSAMVRVGVPGGALTPEQYLALDRMADEAGDGGLRITTRQDVQYHRVGKTNLAALVQSINRNLLTTLAACGDVVRNTTCCPAPLSGLHDELQAYALALSRRLKPKTRAYYEIWLDGEKAIAAQAPEEEPLYGTAYLPRKFKIGLAPPGDNCIDLYTNDLGIVPVVRDGVIRAFTLLAGGGMGMSPGVKTTHPRLADPICTVAPELLERAAEAVVTIHRDYGNRENRKLARLKYVLDDWGVARFRTELETRVGAPLADPEPLSWNNECDHLGWQQQGPDAWFLGLHVPSGRVKDVDAAPLRTCLREIIERYRPTVRLTPQQNILLGGIRERDRAAVEESLRSFGVPLPSSLLPLVRDALACPALPTCGLAITEAERALPGLLGQIHAAQEAASIGREALTVRVTGCPNGCARPYTSEIGIVGQSVELYTLYLGASHLGTRMGFAFADNVRAREIGQTLQPVFELYRRERSGGERFGDFCNRVGRDRLREVREAASAEVPG